MGNVRWSAFVADILGIGGLKDKAYLWGGTSLHPPPSPPRCGAPHFFRTMGLRCLGFPLCVFNPRSCIQPSTLVALLPPSFASGVRQGGRKMFGAPISAGKRGAAEITIGLGQRVESLNLCYVTGIILGAGGLPCRDIRMNTAERERHSIKSATPPDLVT